MKSISNKEIKKLIEKDEVVFNKVFYEYKDKIYYYISRTVHDKGEAEQLVIDVFMKMLNCIETYDSKRGNFESFLIIISKSILTDYYRRYRKGLEFYDHEFFDKDNNLQMESNRNDKNLFYEIQGILNEYEYNIFMYHDIYQYKFIDISKELNISKYKVNAYYTSAVEKIEKYIKENY